jgi:major membrane immunogen (membrane-anchored lipoprotein)
MKKYFILFAVVALISMTACNEKPAKTEKSETPASEQVDTAKQAAQPKVNVEKAAPTEDGKDHIVAEFDTQDNQVRLENLADGTYRLSMWKKGQDKGGKADQVIETKKCVLQGGNYLMRDEDGTVYVIDSNKGSVAVMDKKNIKKL